MSACPEDFCFRPAGGENLAGVLDVYNSNPHFLEKHLSVERVTEKWLRRELDDMKKAGFQSCAIVERESGKIIGTADFLSGEEIYLSLLILHRGCQKKGLGGPVYRALEGFACLPESRRVRIDVVADYDDAVTDFWKRNGFRAVGDTDLKWGNLVLHACVMRKNILWRRDG